MDIVQEQQSKRSANPSSKFSLFTVLIFSGEATEGSDFLEDIERVFASNIVASYFTDTSTCDANPDWSNALASRIRQSLSKSKILSFLATEQKDEKRCHVVYKALGDHLSTVGIKMARTFEEYQRVFDLKCDTLYDFLSFYSGVRTSVRKFETSDSIAIKDDTFIRTFFCRAPDVPELQTTSKGLTTNTKDSCMKMFESIHADYIYLSTSSVLRDTEMTLTRTSCHAEVRSSVGRGEVKVKPAFVSKLPLNTNNLILQKVDNQM